jgi:[acyl-carrier-protein] S-malonyltransferase
LAVIQPRRSVMLPVSAPFHCRLMRSAEEKLSLDLDSVEFKDLAFPVVTNVDARIIHLGEEARESLKRQVTHSVLWFKSMETMAREGIDVFVELGTGNVLSGLMKRIGRDWPSPPLVLSAEDVAGLEKAREALS